MNQRELARMRHLMVEHQLKSNGIFDESVLRAMAEIPRHEFISQTQRSFAYANMAHPIGFQQHILAPLTIAKMLQSLRLSGSEMILEVGTGSGYLTALLMLLGSYVFSLECIPQLAEQASNTLQSLKYSNVDLHIGDGSQGLPDMASFDVIVITAHVRKIPKPLALQMNPLSGRMLIPVGNSSQQKMKLIRREANQWHSHSLMPVSLAPLTGRYGKTPPSVTA